MYNYQPFLIQETDRFDPQVFPQLDSSLQQIVARLAQLPAGPSAAMIVSYAKNHSINSQQAMDHPELAGQISTKGLPLQVMEQLFESSRQNPAYRQALEAYVTAYLTPTSA